MNCMNCGAACEKYECVVCKEFRDQFAKALQKARSLYECQIANQKVVMKAIKRKLETPTLYQRYEKLRKSKGYASFIGY